MLIRLRDSLIIVLLVAIALTIFTADWTDAAVIALVIVVNTGVGVVQEVKADRAITAPATMTEPEARVLRDAQQRLTPAGEVILGDLLILAEGDIVAAAATVVEAAALLVDEAALTGVSVPVDKTAARKADPGDAVEHPGTGFPRAPSWSAAVAGPWSPQPAPTARWAASPGRWSPVPG